MSYIKCPICEQKMDVDGNDYEGESITSCKNGCYYVEFMYGNYKVYVFDDLFGFSHTTINEEREKITKEIDDLVQYWKKDDRYIMKILERGTT